MSKLLLWLERNPVINALLALAFFLAVVALHDEVTRLAINMRRTMSVDSYNLFFSMATLTGFLLWLVTLWRHMRKPGSIIVVGFFLLPTLFLTGLFFAFALTYSIEAVHFFQYAILAVLLFPLVKSYGATVFWATLLGVLDEIYQYVILTPTFHYFDFNDILLNLLGAGIAVVSIRLMTGGRFTRKQQWKGYLPVFTAALLIAAAFVTLYLMNYIRWYPAAGTETPRWFAINRTPALESFWIKAYEGKLLHILGPWEGIALLAVLMAYYFLLDRVKGSKLRWHLDNKG